MNRDLDYVLNYMVKYTQDRYMQDSEPMLNHRDIELVLKHIWELEDKIDKAIEYIIKNSVLSNEWYEIECCKFIPTGHITYRQLTSKKVKELLEILGDKE